LLPVPFADAAPAPRQQTAPAPLQQSAPSIEGQPQDSNSESAKPATNTTSPGDPQTTAPNADPSQSTDRNVQSAPSQPVVAQQQNGATPPVGTAAAPYERTTGVAASRPAGAVVAPARQRRARSFFIKMGVVIGAGVAIGTVLALSHASPSQPH
jgi:hypothetical protein